MPIKEIVIYVAIALCVITIWNNRPPPKGAGVYTIHLIGTNKWYVGESVQVRERWRQHRADLAKGEHHSIRLQADWNRYPHFMFRFCCRERFLFTGLANQNKLKIALMFREGWWIDKKNSYLTYNTEKTIEDLKWMADTGRTNNRRLAKYRGYRKFIRRNIWCATHWSPPMLTATLYNPLAWLMVWGSVFLIVAVAYQNKETIITWIGG